MTYFEAWDARQRVALWLMTGPTNVDADFERNIATMKRLDAQGCVGAVLLADAENPAPSAVWRRRLGETAASLENRRAFALVTSSFAIRGTLIALQWMFGARGAAVAAANLDEARAVLAKHIGFAPVLAHLVDDVREQAARAGLAPAPGGAVAGDRRRSVGGRRRDDFDDPALERRAAPR